MCDTAVTARSPRRAGTRGAYVIPVMELLTSDGSLAVLTALGIVATAVSIVRDAKAQRARAVTEEVPADLPRAA